MWHTFPTGCKVSKTDGVELSNPSKFRHLIGRLLYLTVTRPDIMFATQQLSQFMSNPMDTQWKLGLRVLRYLKGTQHLQMMFTFSKDPQLRVYSDSNWWCCLDTHNSLTGSANFMRVVLFLGKPRNKLLLPGHPLKPSTGQWLQSSMKHSGSLIFWLILTCRFHYQCNYIVTTSRWFKYCKKLCIMSKRSILTSIVTLLGIMCNQGSLTQYLLIRPLKL